MRCLPALALFLGSLTLSAAAQRGGGHVGGGGGGFSGGHAGGFGGHAGGFSGAHSGGFSAGARSSFPGIGAGQRFASPGFRGGLPSTARPGFYSGARTFSNSGLRSGAFGAGVRPGGRPYAAGISPVRPGFGGRYGANGGLHRGYGYPYGGGRYGYGRYGYGGYGYYRGFYPRFFSPVFLSYGFYNPFFWGFDPFWNTGDWLDSDATSFGYGTPPAYGGQPYANQGYSGQPYPTQTDPSQAYQGQPAPPEAAGFAQGPALVPNADGAAADEAESNPWAPQRYAERPSGANTVALQENTVTILFKDGRQPEKVRNYALTRNSLFISGPHARVIPVDEIDLPGTERLNRAAGVDFRTP